MDRETKELTTQSGDKVVIKSWLTGGENEAIQDIFLASQEIGQQSDIKIKGSLITDANHKTIETVVVSVNGDDKDILKKCLNLKAKDYKFIIDEINKTLKDDISAEKKS